MVDITINEQDGRLVAALNGELDNVASSQAERDFAPVFERDDCDIVVDCTQLTYISSSGLRIVLNIFKHARTCGHKLIIKGMTEDIEEIFQMSGFLQLFMVEK